MKLKPVRPTAPYVRVLCSKCESMVWIDECYADLDASAGTYYCVPCSIQVLIESREEEE